MASDINKVIMIGRLVKDPELRYTQGGSSVANFSLAVNYSYKKGEGKVDQASFFNCIAWGKLGEVICQYCKKGQRLAIEGRLQQRSWEDKEGKKQYAIEIVVDGMQMLTPKGGEGAAQTVAPDSAAADVNFEKDSDIPF